MSESIVTLFLQREICKSVVLAAGQKVENKRVLKKTLKQKPLKSYFYGLMILSSFPAVHAAETQFNDALRFANAGDVSQLEQYRATMQGDALGYYPEK